MMRLRTRGEGRIIGLREDNGVFNRNAALIVLAIQDPSLHLPACQLTGVHAQMKRVQVVIHCLAHMLKALPQCSLIHRNRLGLHYTVISNPSHASGSFRADDTEERAGR
jgi:hypothetical protein